jgi:plastocyanin
MKLGLTASLLACVAGAGVAVGALTLEPSALPATAPAAAGTHHSGATAPGYGQAAAPQGGAQGGANQNAGAAAQATLEVDNFQFSGQVRVAPGGTVTVINNDSAPHTATARDDSFNTGNIAAGATRSFTAPTEPGTYQFFCAVHPSMTGTLVVG